MRITHTTGRANFSIVHLDGYQVAFSYETPIGFAIASRPWVLRDNEWGPTTGKHLNNLDERKINRLPGDEFLKALVDVVDEYRAGTDAEYCRVGCEEVTT